MKKIISIIIAIAIAMGSALSAYASEKYYVAYDDNGNRYVLREDQILGITYDAEGNIVDTEISTRTAYLQGTKKTIPAGGKFTSYQYTANIAFGIGFYFAYYDDENPNAHKIDCVLFAADDTCRAKLGEYAKNKLRERMSEEKYE